MIYTNTNTITITVLTAITVIVIVVYSVQLGPSDARLKWQKIARATTEKRSKYCTHTTNKVHNTYCTVVGPPCLALKSYWTCISSVQKFRSTIFSPITGGCSEALGVF